jgi:hypothetical protein
MSWERSEEVNELVKPPTTALAARMRTAKLGPLD